MKESDHILTGDDVSDTVFSNRSDQIRSDDADMQTCRFAVVQMNH